MAQARRVVFLVTGGHTIATGDLAKIQGLPQDVRLEIEQFIQTPSHELGPLDIQRIALRARDLARDSRHNGVVVVHGTATLEYTAFLTDLYLGADSHVVFTGPTPGSGAADDPRSVLHGNLRDAVLVALDAQARGCGALVCFGGQIRAARDTWKQYRHAPDPFIGLADAWGSVTDGRVSLSGRPRHAHVFPGALEPGVVVVRAYPGATPDQVAAAVRAGAKGIVVEGYPGVGPMPLAMIPALRDATDRGVAVVISSRAPIGAIPSPPTGGTGGPLQGLPLISSGKLTTEQAMVLLMAALAETSSPQEVAVIFADVAWK